MGANPAPFAVQSQDAETIPGVGAQCIYTRGVSIFATFLEEYRSEVNVAAASFFAWKSINNFAGADAKILDAMQTSALAWRIIAHSLQITFFTALGRIFDRDSRSLTIHSFIAACREHISEFSKGALEARRLRDAHGVRPSYLDDYLKGVYEPVVSDFQEMEDTANRYALIYRTNYQPIRHKLIAHKDVASITLRDALYANTNIDEVEEILQFLHGVQRVVEQLYLNGRLTKPADFSIRIKEDVQESVEKLLRSLL